jgi:hypothetical protein
MKQKLMQGMMERNRTYTLHGDIEADDAYIGGELTGGKRGRGSENKSPFVAAVSKINNRPGFMKLSPVKAFGKSPVFHWARRSLSGGESTTVRTDGLACFRGIAQAGFGHEVVKQTGTGKKAGTDPSFHWVNTILGNVKNSISGAYHAISRKHTPRYLAEFEYRFNRRFDLVGLFARTLRMMLKTPPMPERLLKLADSYS